MNGVLHPTSKACFIGDQTNTVLSFELVLVATAFAIGLFSTRNNDNSPLTAVTRGEIDFVTAPTADATANQAAGRIVFTDIPTASNPPSPGEVGLSSIRFDRSGGPNNSFHANVSASGRVISEDTP